MDIVVNHEMIQLARESRACTQEKLAQRTGISQGHISKFEQGQLPVPEQQLEKIARVLDYPRAFFMLRGAIYGLGISNLYHRKRKTVPSQKLKQIQALLNLYVLQIQRLLSAVDLDSKYAFHTLDSEDYNNNAAEIAQLVRAQWHIPLGPITDLVGVIERAGGIVIKCDFDTLKFDAQSRWLKDEGLPPMFYINKEAPGDRIRFTLAHEVGHVIMHRIPTPNIEREANQFAAEFLMPEGDIRDDLSQFSLQRAAKLKMKWKVSIAALTKRAADLKVISEAQYRRYFTQLGAMGYRRREPVEIASEQPHVLPQIIQTYRKELGYTQEELCQILAVNKRDFERMYMGQFPIRLIRN